MSCHCITALGNRTGRRPAVRPLWYIVGVMQTGNHDCPPTPLPPARIPPARIQVRVAIELPGGGGGIEGDGGCDAGAAAEICDDPEWLAGVVRCGLAQVLPPDAAGQVSLLIADDAVVRELNREYRGLDATTDVLSFSAQHGGHWEGDDGDDAAVPLDGAAAAFPLPDGEPPPLGEIVVSLPQAARQARAAGVPLRQELALLLAHGALHLLGYDHYDAAEQAAMQALERAALAAVFPDGAMPDHAPNSAS